MLEYEENCYCFSYNTRFYFSLIWKITFANLSLFVSFINNFLQFSWGPLLKDVSRLDDEGLKKANRQVPLSLYV